MTPRTYYSDEAVTVIHGDALDYLKIPMATNADGEPPFDAIITDPPYASGARTEATKTGGNAMRRGERWGFVQAIENDQLTTPGFLWVMRETLQAAIPSLVDGGSVLCFIDWRQWPNLVGVVESINLRVNGMIVWDKAAFGMGTGFRNQHELILHASKGTASIFDHSTGNVLRVRRDKSQDHPTPKPVELLAKLIEVVVPEGGTVFDPFMGAGSTLRAAKLAGRRAVGVEVLEVHCETAACHLRQGALAL